MPKKWVIFHFSKCFTWFYIFSSWDIKKINIFKNQWKFVNFYTMQCPWIMDIWPLALGAHCFKNILTLKCYLTQKKLDNTPMIEIENWKLVYLGLFYIMVRDYDHGEVESLQNTSKSHPMEVFKSFMCALIVSKCNVKCEETKY